MKGENKNEMKNENENEKPTYSQQLKNLGFVCNGRITKDNAKKFKTILGELKNDYQTSLSVNFVKGLITRTPDKAKKRLIVFNLLKKSEIRTEEFNRYYCEFDYYGNRLKTKERLKFLVV